jgi:hypothetical protein
MVTTTANKIEISFMAAAGMPGITRRPDHMVVRSDLQYTSFY